jgi:tRNA/rRNA methyltransferase
MTIDRLQAIQIILVEPAGARNIGSIVRIMKNMGLSRLVLVNPECDHLSDEARHMAVHAADLLETAKICPSLAIALQGVHRAVATIGRDSDRTLESPRSLSPWLLAQDHPDQPLQTALIFGREDHGLNNDDLKYAQRYLCIPASPDYLSLNLAQAVGICCYELYQASLAEAVPLAPTPPPAALDQLEGYFHQLETLLLDIGYLYPHTVTSRMESLRTLVKRSDPSAQEIAMLRGMIRQGRWALQNPIGNSRNSPPAED